MFQVTKNRDVVIRKELNEIDVSVSEDENRLERRREKPRLSYETIHDV